MKNLIPFILAFTLGMPGFGQQSITLSFNGIDSLTGNPVALDQVYIQNTTSGCDTTLFGPDPTITLLIFVGMNENPMRLKDNFTILSSGPNPSYGSTIVQIMTVKEQTLRLFLSDISGKKLFEYQNSFETGLHRFSISTSGDRLIFLNASDGIITKTIKLINLSNGISQYNITYSGTDPLSLEPSRKNLETSGFIYYIGDQLSFTAIAARYYNDTIIDSPFQDTTYTFELTHLPWQCGDPVYYEEQTYNTVQISTQCWMKENLNVGKMINTTQNQADNDTIEKYCYNNIAWNCAIYGGLYQWDEMMQYTTTSGAIGLCPPGWHLPTDQEWTILTYFLGGTEVAGGKLKEAGYAHWLPPNTGATNESGFTGFPGGWWAPVSFSGIGTHAHFWSSTQTSSTQACNRVLFNAFASIQSNNNNNKIQAESVRCIKTILR
jgi:uncharacterized protein (TIGR02145 family)